MCLHSAHVRNCFGHLSCCCVILPCKLRDTQACAHMCRHLRCTSCAAVRDTACAITDAPTSIAAFNQQSCTEPQLRETSCYRACRPFASAGSANSFSQVAAPMPQAERQQMAAQSVPAPAPQPATSTPWFTNWGPSHVVGVILGFAVLMLAAAVLAIGNMLQPFLKVCCVLGGCARNKVKLSVCTQILCSAVRWHRRRQYLLGAASIDQSVHGCMCDPRQPV